MQTYPHVTALAQRLNKPLIAFDLEHTGGKGRGITEFGATVVTQTGEVLEYVSLVKPRAECEFVPFVCRLTGIWPEHVESAPGWLNVLEQFVMPQINALWVGFNSRSADMPIIRKESESVGVDASVLLHLDLMRVNTLKGSLTDRVRALWPGIDVSGAHRALADSRFTMLLLEGTLAQGVPIGDQIVGGQLCLTQNVQDAQAAKPKRSPGQPFDPSFLVKDSGRERRGEPWTDSERIWVVSQFKKGKTPVDLGKANGRTAYAVAYRLHSEELIDKPTRETFRHL